MKYSYWHNNLCILIQFPSCLCCKFTFLCAESRTLQCLLCQRCGEFTLSRMVVQSCSLLHAQPFHPMVLQFSIMELDELLCLSRSIASTVRDEHCRSTSAICGAAMQVDMARVHRDRVHSPQSLSMDTVTGNLLHYRMRASSVHVLDGCHGDDSINWLITARSLVQGECSLTFARVAWPECLPCTREQQTLLCFLRHLQSCFCFGSESEWWKHACLLACAHIHDHSN